MAMQTITRKLWFSAGHRVHGHEGHCANLHGHNYIVHVTAWAPELDSLGRVIDFKVLKNRIDPWLQENWDHGFMWYKDDPVCHFLFKTPSGWNPEGSTFKNFECPFNPTAENIAHHLLAKVCPILLKDTQVIVVKVEVWETENCKAEAIHPALVLAAHPDGFDPTNPKWVLTGQLA